MRDMHLPRIEVRQSGPVLRKVKRRWLTMMRNETAEVKIMAREKIMAMPLASDKWRVCARIMCGDASKKIDAFFGRDIVSPK